MALQGIPDFGGRVGITLSVPNAVVAADFHRQAFGGEEIARYLVDRHPPSISGG
jgi:hypothetical protein